LVAWSKPGYHPGMRKTLLFGSTVLMALSAWVVARPDAPATQPVAPALAFTLNRLDGTPQPLSAYAGKVVLVVNTASKCGFTKQYAGLEALHRQYKDQGLAVLGFPSDNFNGQEFDTDDEIAQFCKDKFGVSFDLFSKVDVKGETQTPFFAYLTKQSPDPGEIRWNFEKFLIGKDGSIVARWRSKTTPDSAEMKGVIEQELAKRVE
jgi:glutathione peroxidase